MIAQKIKITRMLPVGIDRVFAAWSDPAVISQWFKVDRNWTAQAFNDFRVGGQYRIEMHRGEAGVFVATGEYREISPPNRLTFTWTSGPGVSDTLVTVELRAVAAGTELTLTHNLLPNTEALNQHEQGWIDCLDNLQHCLTST